MSHSFRTSIFMSKDDFIAYLDEYVSQFNVHPRCRHHVDSAIYDEYEELWELKVKNMASASSTDARLDDRGKFIIGCGNSGMESTNGLADNGAHASLVVRSQSY
ncbi:unnamed protein product [Malus baccata var. baccata]